MSKVKRIVTGIVIFTAVVAVGVLVGYLASSSRPSGTTVASAPGSTDETSARAGMTNKAAVNIASNQFSGSPSDRNRTHPGVTPPAPLPNPVPVTIGTNQVPDWEEKVDAILTADNDTDSQKAKKMLELFPLLSGDAQEEVAHHISNLISDEDYAAFGNYLTNKSLSEDVLDVLLEDVLNRPNSIKLPMLLEVARDPQNPKAAEAKDVLELFLEEDYGNDWAKWQVETTKWLKDNPD